MGSTAVTDTAPRAPRTRPSHLLVDGTALARAEGRPPSVQRLLGAVDALRAAFPTSTVTVVVDAGLRHRLPRHEARLLDDAVLAGRVVFPPAGCAGGTAGFLRAVTRRARGEVTVVGPRQVPGALRRVAATRRRRGGWRFEPVTG